MELEAIQKRNVHRLRTVYGKKNDPKDLRIAAIYLAEFDIIKL